MKPRHLVKGTKCFRLSQWLIERLNADVDKQSELVEKLLIEYFRHLDSEKEKI